MSSASGSAILFIHPATIYSPYSVILFYSRSIDGFRYIKRGPRPRGVPGQRDRPPPARRAPRPSS
ncbi:hypothetical protein NQ318_000128 [Aromia moschata]|uniref:Uncharacterized protein n=1 Tax=Aromia moschata TaxID=1265417 RepID=A0AAV8X0G3_9CUCU|nr:hypothetical protein NQ318_000128 [Aromia moschata]